MFPNVYRVALPVRSSKGLQPLPYRGRGSLTSSNAFLLCLPFLQPSFNKRSDELGPTAGATGIATGP